MANNCTKLSFNTAYSSSETLFKYFSVILLPSLYISYMFWLIYMYMNIQYVHLQVIVRKFSQHSFPSNNLYHTLLCYAKSLQSCPTLCDPIDGSLPGSPVPGILQARTLEWVAISFSNAWKWKEKVKSLSRVRLFSTPWTAAYQSPPSMGFSRQEYWSGVPLPSPLPHFRDTQ